MFGAEEGLGALHRDPLREVDDLAAAVVPCPRIALGVFVAQGRPEGGEDGRRGEVLRGDQLESVALPGALPEQYAGDLRVLAQQGGEVRGAGRPGPGLTGGPRPVLDGLVRTGAGSGRGAGERVSGVSLRGDAVVAGIACSGPRTGDVVPM
ncbi:hypothetical protein Srufu_025130 [Streptomyces libani subsp. rufus]|nr:hypothetical protein Srufu_025130 [Streptomyces libani subsp. rufus]